MLHTKFGRNLTVSNLHDQHTTTKCTTWPCTVPEHIGGPKDRPELWISVETEVNYKVTEMRAWRRQTHLDVPYSIQVQGSKEWNKTTHPAEIERMASHAETCKTGLLHHTFGLETCSRKNRKSLHWRDKFHRSPYKLSVINFVHYKLRWCNL